MVMYSIEVVKKNKKRKMAIMLFIMAFILIGLAVFGGIKLAQYEYLVKNPIDFSKESNPTIKV